jgi:predicted house-cleaning noncanonical NTP pyrophosphatase (MazG superfamily)
MGWKLVRDRNEEWCRTHGVSGQWRISPDPSAAILRKLFEETGEFAQFWNTGELYDLLDVIRAAIQARPFATAYHPEDAQDLPESMTGLFSLVVTELNRYATTRKALALHAMERAVDGLIALQDPDGWHARRHRAKVAEMGEFARLVEWCPVPGATGDGAAG